MVSIQSRETQITMVKWTNASGQTKRANERYFVYRPPAWRRWRNVKITYTVQATGLRRIQKKRHLNSQSFNLHCHHFNAFNLSKFDEMFIRTVSELRNRKKKLLSYVFKFFTKRVQRYVQKSVMHVQSCCLADLKLLCSPFAHLLKFCLTIVSNFSWVLQWSQEKLKTMLMQNFWGTNKLYSGRCANSDLLLSEFSLRSFFSLLKLTNRKIFFVQFSVYNFVYAIYSFSRTL